MIRIEKNTSSLLELIDKDLWADWIEEVYLERKDQYFPFELDGFEDILSILKDALEVLSINDNDIIIRAETKRAFQNISTKKSLRPQKIVDFIKLLYVVFDNNLNTVLKELIDNCLKAMVQINKQNFEVSEVKSFFSHLADLLLEWRIKIKEYRNDDRQGSSLIKEFEHLMNAENSILCYSYRNKNNDNPYWYYILIFKLIINDELWASVIMSNLLMVQELEITEEEYTRREKLAFKAFSYIIDTPIYSENLFKEDLENSFDSQNNLTKFKDKFDYYLDIHLPFTHKEKVLENLPIPALVKNVLESDVVDLDDFIKATPLIVEEDKNLYQPKQVAV